MGERVKDKVAIVTGAGSSGPGWGNGKAVAVLFAREGAKVFAVDRNRAAVEETVSIIAEEGGQATLHTADVSQGGAVATLVRRCLAHAGRSAFDARASIAPLCRAWAAIGAASVPVRS